MLYLHLPFCKAKCAYCAFCSGVYSEETMGQYVQKLISFLQHHAHTKTFHTIYIGGGTPSSLPIFLWEQLLSALEQCVDLSALEEFTVELNPESTTEALLALLQSKGVNRLSFGVQSLKDLELRSIGRLHTAKQALDALHLARKAGFSNLGADLIYGLPGQTAETFAESLSTLLEQPITHLSCYNLQLEEGTPLCQNQEKYSFADEEEQMRMYDTLLRLAARAGMEHYEISNFAQPGKRAVHNSGYWTGVDYLGLGAAAHSKLGNCRYSFAEDVSAFLQKEDFSFDECVSLSETDLREETVMLGLRTDRGVEMSLIDEQKAHKFISCGLAFIRQGRLVLNDQGMILSNTIISELI